MQTGQTGALSADGGCSVGSAAAAGSQQPLCARSARGESDALGGASCRSQPGGCWSRCSTGCLTLDKGCTRGPPGAYGSRMDPLPLLEAVRTAPTLLEGMRAASTLADAVAGSGAEAVGDLASAAHSDDPVTALAAVHALAVCDDLQGAAVLSGLLHDERRHVSEHALDALRHTTPVADALPHLVGASRDGGFTGMLAQRTLESWAAQQPDQVRAALQTGLAAGVRRRRASPACRYPRARARCGHHGGAHRPGRRRRGAAPGARGRDGRTRRWPCGRPQRRGAPRVADPDRRPPGPHRPARPLRPASCGGGRRPPRGSPSSSSSSTPTSTDSCATPAGATPAASPPCSCTSATPCCAGSPWSAGSSPSRVAAADLAQFPWVARSAASGGHAVGSSLLAAGHHYASVPAVGPGRRCPRRGRRGWRRGAGSGGSCGPPAASTRSTCGWPTSAPWPPPRWPTSSASPSC